MVLESLKVKDRIWRARKYKHPHAFILWHIKDFIKRQGQLFKLLLNDWLSMQSKLQGYQYVYLNIDLGWEDK